MDSVEAKTAKIMMVDDEPTTMDILQTYLEGEGYSRFLTTTDPQQALGLLEQQTPDVLLLDLVMPKIGGLEILASVRQDEALKHTPVIILTSSVDAETKLKALELGATDFLGKPVDPSELALRLRNTLAAKAYQDRLAYFDRLTGLPNRRSFMERLARVLARAEHEALKCTVLHIDLDRFTQINATLGEVAGDELLKAVSVRLEQCVRPSDFLVSPDMRQEGNTLSRVGGDEFSLFLPGLGSVEGAARIARHVLASLAEPFCVAGRELFVTGSIGIALYPDDGRDVETLLKHANVAMSHARQNGSNDYQFYNESLNAQSVERLHLENELRRAIDRDQLILHYQPKIDPQSGRITSAEALMRWLHPELGLVPPVVFIPIAEETDLISPLGDWGLVTACRQNRAWQEAGFDPISVAVNVSSKQFRRGNLPETVENALEESGLESRYLVLELTESVIMQNPEETVEMLHRIKEMGVKISVDDFGTGYSSLSTLRRFPLDELKVDRSFVNGVPHDSDGAAIVTAIIGMAHTLGMSVVAEGVETDVQLEFLRQRGCEECQGYYFSKPAPADAWPEIFRKFGADR